jgi:threonine synthase
MPFYSTQNQSQKVNFNRALLSGTAEDGGLFMPEMIPFFDPKDHEKLERKNFAELAATIAEHFVDGQIPKNELLPLCQDAYDFELPWIDLSQDEKVLELFHGPTLAFKDFAARFMARCVSYFSENNGQKRQILVATSGDTGGAVGHGFLGTKNTRVFILYPQGGVSPIQEAQLTTMGKNVTTFEVQGNFDDCQRLVKSAFADPVCQRDFNLMSANSINIGRIIPQSFYYFYSSLKFKKKYPDRPLIYSVPSGNFGNIFGGILAQKMGAPIDHFIAANNANHPFFDYLETGRFAPTASVPTLSNAMDIGHPNNYYRLDHFFDHQIERVRAKISGAHFDDAQTKQSLKTVFEKTGYIMCPHTTIAHLGVEKYRSIYPKALFVTVATAHPAKFYESVSSIIGQDFEIPQSLKRALSQKKQTHLIPPTLEALRIGLRKN